MSKFHSVVSRRDFMKALGLGAAGLGAAAATTPVFHDLDEVTSTPHALQKKPWYIKERDFENPTVEIDWSQITRLDQSVWTKVSPYQYRVGTHPDSVFARENYDRLVKEFMTEHNVDGAGDTIRDLACSSAVGASGGNQIGQEGGGFLGLQQVQTPEQRNIPRWNGNPEENLRTVRSFLRLVGGFDVGCVEMTANTRKLIFSRGFYIFGSAYGKPVVRDYVFEDVDEAYETDTKWVIPNKCKYMLVYTTVQPTGLNVRAPSRLGGSAVSLAYNRGHNIVHQIQGFIRGLGYQALSGHSFTLTPSAPFGPLSGVGEHARMATVVVSPTYGASIRLVDRILTDLPLAPTKPIDAGINRFCETCKICAETCPFGSLSMGPASWEHQRVGSPSGNGNAPGYRGWRMDTLTCTYCQACQAVCPFNSLNEASAHDLVKTIVATTSIFNGFFTNMDKTFGYGIKEPESWWDLDNEPVFGIASSYLQ